jgi:hypothetical protein
LAHGRAGNLRQISHVGWPPPAFSKSILKPRNQRENRVQTQIRCKMPRFSPLPGMYRNRHSESRDFFNKRPRPAFYQRISKCLVTHKRSAPDLRADRGLEAAEKCRFDKYFNLHVNSCINKNLAQIRIASMIAHGHFAMCIMGGSKTPPSGDGLH